jgi:tRNA U34 5-methylaminomethyl-2-thiouridine-forming methyltransferase MnmC
VPDDPAPVEPDRGAPGSGRPWEEPAPVDWASALVVTDDGTLTLRSTRYGETFRSRRGAHAEARHVFVDGTGAGPRLRAGRATQVLEVGLGAATNLVLTVAAALAGRAPLRYRVWEPDPLPAAAWAILGHEHVLAPPVLGSLLAARGAWGRPAPGSVHVWRHDAVVVEVVVAPVPALSVDDDASTAGEIDAIYLDPFSPAVNPDAWTPAVLRGLARRLRPGGVLASYSVAGAVRRALADAGLEVAKVPGPPGGKREVLRARRPDAADESGNRPPAGTGRRRPGGAG